MATIKNIKPGATLWERRRTRMGNTMCRQESVYSYRIEEVDSDKMRVFASWNGNPPRWYQQNTFKKWLLKKPEPKKNIFERMGEPRG